MEGFSCETALLECLVTLVIGADSPPLSHKWDTGDSWPQSDRPRTQQLGPANGRSQW